MNPPVFNLEPATYDLGNARICLAGAARAYGQATISVGSTQVLCEELGNAVLVSFPGTASIEDFVTDASCWEKRDKFGSGIHAGFQAAIDDVIEPVYRWLDQHPNLPIFVDGHSLGASLGMLLAKAIDFPAYNLHSVYTFGQPRTGDAQFCRRYDLRLRARTWRFVNGSDPVPHLPPLNLGYRHCGQEVLMDGLLAYGEPNLTFNPSMARQAEAEVSAAWRNWRSGHLAFLPSHYITAYEKGLGIASDDSAVGIPASRTDLSLLTSSPTIKTPKVGI